MGRYTTKDKMKTKLLLVSDTYKPQVDGTVIFIEEFLKRSREIFDITLLVPGFKGIKDDSYKKILLDISRFLTPLPTYPSIRLSLLNLKKIRKAIREADIIFIQGPAAVSYLAMYYAHKYRKKVVAYTHVLSWELFEKSKHWLIGLFSKLLKKACIFFYNYCDEVLVPYQELEGELKREGIKAKMTTARLGVDIDRFSPAADIRLSKNKVGIDKEKFVIGYVGRLSREKNINVLKEAFLRLGDENNAYLLIVGDGAAEQKEEFQKMNNCTVTGFVSNVQDYLKAMDIFIMPSLTETTSLATLEAMSCGLPVVVTKVGFMKRYVIKDHNGLFFPRNNPATLAMKIRKLISDHELRRILGKNARKTIAYSFSWERSINKIKRILLSLCLEKK